MMSPVLASLGLPSADHLQPLFQAGPTCLLQLDTYSAPTFKAILNILDRAAGFIPTTKNVNNPNMYLLGGLFQGRPMTADEIRHFVSSHQSLEQSHMELLGLLSTPSSTITNLLGAPALKLSLTLQGLEAQRAEAGAASTSQL